MSGGWTRWAGWMRSGVWPAGGERLEALAAELRGLTAFRTPHHIAGILLNDCTQNMCTLLKPMLKKRPVCPWSAACRRCPRP